MPTKPLSVYELNWQSPISPTSVIWTHPKDFWWYVESVNSKFIMPSQSDFKVLD